MNAMEATTIDGGRHASIADRTLVTVAVLAVAAALGAAFWPAFFGRVFLYADLAMFHLPTRLFYAAQLADGQPSLWLPNLFCGFNLHGEGQVGMYHPLHWLLYRTLPLSAAFNLECALAYPFAFAGATLFLRRLQLPAPAAVFGAMTFALSGWMLARMTHVNTVTIVAHLPWLLWATDIVLRDPTGPRRDLALVAVALLRGSQLLLGQPAPLFLSALCEAAYVIPVAIAHRRVLPLCHALLANAVGLGVGAVQLLPTLEHFGTSLRADTSVEYRTAQSLHPLSLLQPWAPYLFRDRAYQIGFPNPVEQAFYLGAVVPVAATWVVLRWRQLERWRVLRQGAVVTAVVGLLLALGRYSPIFHAVTTLPIFDKLRVPSRYSLLIVASAAIFSAVAYADLLVVSASQDPPIRRRARLIWFAPVPATIIVAWLRPLLPLEQLTGAPDALIGLGLSVVASGFWFAAACGRRAALLALILFTVADQTTYGAALWWTVPPTTVEQFIASTPDFPLEPSHRLLDHSAVMIDRNTRGDVVYRSTTPLIMHGIRLVHGYAGLMPVRRLDYRRVVAQRVAGVALALRGNETIPISSALDRFRLVDHVVVSKTPASAIDTIDVARTAVVESPVDVIAGSPGSVEVRADGPGAMDLITHSSTRQLLVVSESYHTGWRVSMDGAPTPALRVNGDFMGAVVDAGAHEVVLRFEPDSVTIGRALSELALGALLVLSIWRLGAFARKRRLRFHSAP